jgi:hypothetical protein
MDKILTSLLFVFLCSMTQSVENDWRYLEVHAEKEIKISDVKDQVSYDTREVSVIIRKGLGVVDGNILNPLDRDISVSRIERNLDGFSTEVFKDSIWTEFQRIDAGGYHCGNSFYTKPLASNHVLPFQIKKTTSGETTTKFRVKVKIENVFYYSNEIEISLTQEQYDLAGEPILPRDPGALYKFFINKADHLFAEKQFEEAQKYYQLASELFPNITYPRKQIKDCEELSGNKLKE